MDGTEAGYDISPCFFALSRCGVWQAISASFYFSKNFFLSCIVCGLNSKVTTTSLNLKPFLLLWKKFGNGINCHKYVCLYIYIYMLCYTGQLLTFQPEPYDGPEFNESVAASISPILCPLEGLFRPLFRDQLMLGNCPLVGWSNFVCQVNCLIGACPKHYEKNFSHNVCILNIWMLKVGR